MSARFWLGLASILGFLGVAMGAFGAHALKERLTPYALNIFELAARYQLVHALVLAITALWLQRAPSSAAHLAAWAFLGGIVIFCGSLYALALTDIKILGAITPLGGTALLIGWGALAWSAFSS